jgi:hypothetical protein
MLNLNASPLVTLPTYPKFAKLDISMKCDVEDLTKDYPKYSDYNFFSMITYDVDDALELSVLNNNLIVRFKDYIDSKPFYSFLGVTKPEKTADILLKLSASERLEPVLKLIPEIVLDNMNEDARTKYVINEDLDNNDYIYSLSEHMSLDGHKYHTLRPEINQFSRSFPNVEIRPVKPYDLYEQGLKLFGKWKKNKNQAKKSVEGVEYSAFERALRYSRHFNILGAGLYDNENLIALALVDLTNGYPTGAFIKADTSYKGVLKYTQYSIEKLLFERGYKEINCEQDLGIPGLRMAKRSWNPVGYLKKYIIKPK